MTTAIVTGATSGIGRAAAAALAEAGHWVVAAGRDEERGKQVADELASLPGGGTFVAADLTEAGEPERLVAYVADAAGRLDVLVNNAGVHARAKIDQLAVEDFDRIMDLNIRAAVLLTRAAVPALRRSGGVIVNVASEAGLVAIPGQIAYNVSKAALVMLTKSLAADHAADGIRAVSVCPGTTRTPLVDRAIAGAADPDEHERWLASRRPAGRLGRPEEIAAAIAFAASDEAAYMNGSEIVIDGGYTSV